MANVNEVPVVDTVGGGPATLLEPFVTFVRKQRTLLRDNAAAYANRKTRKATSTADGQTAYADKVVPGATFIPAHESRYEVTGKGRKRNYKYFVVHRPGAATSGTSPHTVLRPRDAGFRQAFAYAQRACTLKNTIYTFFIESGSNAATHFVIGKGGELIQMVDLDDVAFHVKGRPHPFDRSLGRVTNDNSLGVELEGPVYDTFSDAQLQTCAKVLRMVHDLYGVSLDYENRMYVLGHEEMDPRRKKDPGPNFPYNKVLKTAQSLQPYSFPNAFQPPIDIQASVEVLVAAAKAGALRFTSNQLREIATAAAGQMSSFARAGRRSTVSRTALMQAAAALSETLTVAVVEDGATRLRQENIYAQFEPAPPPNGVLFDWESGQWKDVTG